MCKRFINVIAFLLLPALTASMCSAAIESITSVTTDNPDGTIPYNLLSITRRVILWGRWSAALSLSRSLVLSAMSLLAGSPWIAATPPWTPLSPPVLPVPGGTLWREEMGSRCSILQGFYLLAETLASWIVSFANLSPFSSHTGRRSTVPQK